jgi:CcmD family protein
MMRRMLGLVVFCLGSLASAPALEAQQGVGTTQAAPAGAASEATIAPAPAPGQFSGLPQAPPPPRTLRAHWHVFVAFAFAWGLLFAYALYLGRRFGGLEAQIRRLEGTGR